MRTYDPTRTSPRDLRVPMAVRVVGPNETGRVCGFCGTTTFGDAPYRDRCGKCGRPTAIEVPARTS